MGTSPQISCLEFQPCLSMPGSTTTQWTSSNLISIFICFFFSFFVLFHSLQGSPSVQLTSAKWDWLTSTKITHCLSVHSSFSLFSLFEVFVPFRGLLFFKRQLSLIVIRVNWLKGHHWAFFVGQFMRIFYIIGEAMVNTTASCGGT